MSLTKENLINSIHNPLGLTKIKPTEVIRFLRAAGSTNRRKENVGSESQINNLKRKYSDD